MANTAGMRNEGDKGTVGHAMPEVDRAACEKRLLTLQLLLAAFGHVSIRGTMADLPHIILLGEILQADMVEMADGIVTFIQL